MKEIIKQAIAENSGLPGNEDIVKKLKKALSLYDKRDYKEISKLTCFGSLAYCCKTASKGGKQCFWRSVAIDLLGLNENDFEKLKEEFDEMIKKASN